MFSVYLKKCGFFSSILRLFKEKIGKSSLIMVSHSEGILRDLCESGVYIKDGEAFWFDNIDDAIKMYHESE